MCAVIAIKVEGVRKVDSFIVVSPSSALVNVVFKKVLAYLPAAVVDISVSKGVFLIIDVLLDLGAIYVPRNRIGIKKLKIRVKVYRR